MAATAAPCARDGAPVAAEPGDGVADTLVERVREALAQVGITTPDQLLAVTRSDTPAERLDVVRLTLRQV
nr:hypothetical protein GCM10020063_042390 [Dactylosporangium thailandense]